MATSLTRCAAARHRDTRISLEEAADASRILLSLRQYQYRRKNLDSEVSSIDTAMLLCGILTCRQHFQDHDIIELAHAIFDRVDWTWLSEDTALLPHGWVPERGFLPYKWDLYSELMMIYLLGMGSSSTSIAA